MTSDLDALRLQYAEAGLRLRDCAREPMAQFTQWFDQARAANVRLPHAMTLATVSPDGRPSARSILLARHDERGFVYCTDEDSPKARATRATPWAALLFYWSALDRQIRVEGQVEPAEDALADAQYARRAPAARLANLTARQSTPVPDRAFLEERLLAALRAHPPGASGAADLPRPAHFRAFRVRPVMVEFFQTRPDFLHDRLRYDLQPDGAWLISRLAP
jgi:pyridoxamine 5'-phosphate oxidase